MKKIPVWKNIVLIFSLIVAIIIATLAWFLTDPRGYLGELTVHVGRATYIQISSDNGKNWSDDLEVDIGFNKNFKEISGNGTTFFEPVYELTENSEGILANEIVSFRRLQESKKYYEQIFDFKSDTTQEIFLAPESTINAISSNGTSFINGAVRVAFFELDENDNETLKYIWAPNSLIEYSNESKTFTSNGNVEANYYYQKSTKPVNASSVTADSIDVAKIPTGGNSSCSGCGYSEEHKFMWSCGEHLPNNAPSVLSISVPEGEKFGYKRMKIRVWLEGYDRECVSQIGSQKFTMNFQFNAQEANNG